MPELPEMQALSERLSEALVGLPLSGVKMIGFTGLKTVHPSPDDLIGRSVAWVGRRAKYLVLGFDDDASADSSSGLRILIHLSQAGRLDIEAPPKDTKPKGSVVRLTFGADGSPGTGILVREYGTQRKAGWWVLGPGDDGPLGVLGPEPDSPEFEALIRDTDTGRHVHTLLRDQRFVAGIGRGYADDALNLARVSPFAPLRSLDSDDRLRLVESIRSVLAEALERERQRTGGLSEAKLGTRFAVHNRLGESCPQCGEPLLRVSYESHEVVYCKRCQTKNRTLADRRLSRLLK